MDECWEIIGTMELTRPGQPDCVTPPRVFAASVTYSEFRMFCNLAIVIPTIASIAAFY